MYYCRVAICAVQCKPHTVLYPDFQKSFSVLIFEGTKSQRVKTRGSNLISCAAPSTLTITKLTGWKITSGTHSK